MPFVQAKCTNCGGILAVDRSHDAAVCPFCQTPFIVEKAINNYNITNNITIQNGATVYFSGADKKEPSKLVVRTGSYNNNPNTFNFDVVGLYDEYGNKVLSLNVNQTKSIEVHKDMVLTAYHLKPNGLKQTLFGADRKLKSNSVEIKQGKTTNIEISFVPNFMTTQLLITVVDLFV